MGPTDSNLSQSCKKNKISQKCYKKNVIFQINKKDLYVIFFTVKLVKNAEAAVVLDVYGCEQNHCQDSGTRASFGQTKEMAFAKNEHLHITFKFKGLVFKTHLLQTLTFFISLAIQYHKQTLSIEYFYLYFLRTSRPC